MKPKHLLIIGVLAYLFLFHGIWSYALKEPDEGRYAEIPREMVESGDYVVPRFFYVRYFEKPPLLYWADALSYKAFGVSEGSFRFPNALAALACVMALYFAGRRWFGERAALLSSVVLLSSFGFFSLARVVTTDMLLTLWLFIALIGFYGYYRERKAPFLYMFYAALGLGTLTKGPVGVALMGATALLHLVMKKDLGFIRQMRVLRGLALYGVIVVPWFLLISLREHEFLWFFFVDQHVLRFLTTTHKRSGPVYYFVPILLLGALPWSVFLPRSVMRAVRSAEFSELRLFLLWSAIFFVFFSLSHSKLPPYILPLFPSIALIMGCFFDRCWDRTATPGIERALCVCLFLTVGAASLFYVYWAPPGGLPGALADAFAMRPLAGGTALLLGAAALAVSVLLATPVARVLSSVFMLLAGFSAVALAFILLNMPLVDTINTNKDLAAIINRLKAPGDRIVSYGRLNESLPFYTASKVYLAAVKGELQMGSGYEDSRGLFLDDGQFAAMLASGDRVFTVLRQHDISRVHAMGVRNISVLACRQDRCLILNR